MNFNLDPTKQDQELIFSRKCQKNKHPVISQKNSVVQAPLQKHRRLFLDTRLNFCVHVEAII